ncbi:amidase family protein [Baekduia alba]|uniref:amidase family protein n=1 Tax=Baekduia alba TaxID=2997333 RepID=UPI002340404C|nr:amidase family protein [Baekduia alba]
MNESARSDASVEVELPELADLRSPWLTVMMTEASAYHEGWLRERPDDYGRDVRALLELGSTLRAVDYVQAQRFRALVRERALEALAAVDVLLLPTVPFTAAAVGARTVDVGAAQPGDLLTELTRFATVASATGLPALSLPCGRDDAGLPIGIQLIGRPFAEARLCQLGHAYEQATTWHDRVASLPVAVPTPSPSGSESTDA